MAKKPHHHGNLRPALIGAGLEILDEVGLAGLTLRGVAARAGVSHAAPAHHFKGLPGLTAALAAHGWQVFAAFMVEDRSQASPAPRAQLLAICNGYLRFVFAHPGLFTLIFNTDSQELTAPEVQLASHEAYVILQQACAPYQPIGPTEGATEMLVWAVVHGLACLQVSGHGGEKSLAAAKAVLAEILPELQLRSATTA